jgi:hypothetical protein
LQPTDSALEYLYKSSETTAICRGSFVRGIDAIFLISVFSALTSDPGPFSEKFAIRTGLKRTWMSHYNMTTACNDAIRLPNIDQIGHLLVVLARKMALRRHRNRLTLYGARDRGIARDFEK